MLEDKIRKQLELALKLSSNPDALSNEVYEWLCDNDGLNEVEWKRAASYFAGWLASTGECENVVRELLELSI